ncbi:hypothetical protein [Catenuloplanes atrovinosus]|uniref:hypothetical protein n=1 Tax=Catenuloplanes atrovinosus TaxID=137266 RepID=UPI00286D21A5|nr:hypothetical protein [Catenuloplanes atrovinosus]
MNDPLVTPPGAGVSGWVSRISDTFKRSWRSVFSIIFVTQFLPGIGIALVAVGIIVAVLISNPDLPDRLIGPDPFGDSPPPPRVTIAVGAALVAGGVALLLVSLWVQVVGIAASTWAIVREAATGQPAGLGAALRYGVRRGFGLVGWSLLGGLLFVLGIVACVLPGIYVAFGLAMLAPVVIFQRQGLGASFGALHRNALTIIVRVIIVYGVVQFASGIVSTLFQIPMAVLTDPATILAFAAGGGVVLALVMLPLQAIQIIGTLLTYAEQRAASAPLTTAQLADELG